MMNPEMMKVAMDQMSKMTPQQMAALQQQVGNITPEMMQQQLRMFNNMTPQQQAEVQRQAGQLTPEQLSARAGQYQQHSAGQQNYQLQAAQNLKAEGNKLHSAGSYRAAAEKYEQALGSVAGRSGTEAEQLQKACRLNLSSCYLNMGQFTACATACSDVLQSEPGNRKALYRRGQAHLGSANYEQAVKDLKAAVKLAPPDERSIIQEKLNIAQEKAGSRIDDDEDDGDADGHVQAVSEPAVSRALPRDQSTIIEEVSEVQPESSIPSTATPGPGMPRPSAAQMREVASAMRANPGMMESMFNISPEEMERMARMSGMSLPPGMTPDMMKQASQMFSQMSPEDLDRIMAHAGSAGPPLAPSSMPAPGSGPGSPPGPGPSVSSMPAPGAGSTQAAAALSPGAGQFQGAAAMLQSNPGLVQQAMEMMQKLPPDQLAAMQQHAMAGAGGSAPGYMPAPEQMKSMEALMNDPKMLESMQQMVASMKPEDLAAMSQQAGVNLTPAQAEQMTKQLQKLTPRQMSMILGAARVFQQVKQAIVTHKMLVLSIVVFVFALLLRWFNVL